VERKIILVEFAAIASYPIAVLVLTTAKAPLVAVVVFVATGIEPVGEYIKNKSL